MSKVILKPLMNLIRSTDMTFEEVRAFEAGIINLNLEEQVELYKAFNYDLTLIYPTFVHYMAKKRAKETGVGWDEAVESELKFLESYIEGKRVGDEVRV